jgi:amino-acid N-acetyltransferase
MPAVLRAARPGDYPEIIGLLQHAGLPIDDLSAARFGWFVVVADSHGRLLATGAIEPLGSCGLVRSLAVSEAARGAGLGRAVLRNLEKRALDRGFSSLYLLTAGQSEFFEQHGYQSVGRDAVPEAVRSCRQFSAMCPMSAVSLVKRLSVPVA